MRAGFIRYGLLASTTLLAATSTASAAMAEGHSPLPAAATVPPTSGRVGRAEASRQADGNSQADIVVTGTLISNPNLRSASPVSVIGQNEIQLRQSNTAEEVLRNLPGAVPSIGSSVNNGNNGAAFVDLRGLGPSRNIVLLDGQRIVPSGLEGRVDLNNIPLALIERVESLTGGAATTYGADAVSGVVNFITRKNFHGVEATVSEQSTESGDGNYLRGDLIVGSNFGDGRGNIVISAGYQHSQAVSQASRDYSFQSIESYSGGILGNANTVPGRFTIGAATQQINPATGALVPTYALYNQNPYNLFQTPFQRYNAFGAAHYKVSDTVQVYARGLYSRNTVKVVIAPSGSFATTLNIPYSNPYLPLAARNQFCAANGLTSVQCAAAAAATSPADPNFRTFASDVSRRMPEVGPRKRTFVTKIYDIRAGVNIGITHAINLDISGQYGDSQDTTTFEGFVLASRLRAAAYASNATTCLSGAPRGAGLTEGSGCVPVNLFGPDGSITPDQVPYLTASSFSTVETTLAQGRALLRGDFGTTTPWSGVPISFAIGAEHRKYTAKQDSDPLSKTVGELQGSSGAIPKIVGGYKVYEAYGELIAPIVANQPLLKSFTVEGGLRLSRYEIAAPGSPSFSTKTYKGAATWEPVSGIKLRGNYQRAVRAPNIGELFTPATAPRTTVPRDPCAGPAPTTNVDLRAICLAQGAPLASIGQILTPIGGGAASTVSGNPKLKPETSDSVTFGAVLQPSFIPGLSISADYYRIKIRDAITTPTAGDLVALCFGTITAASATSASCALFGRNPVTGGLDGDPATTRGLVFAFGNLGTLLTDGIDFEVNYHRNLGFARLALNFDGNWTHRSRFQATPVSRNRECAGYYSTNCGLSGTIQPKFSWNSRASLGFKAVDVSLLWRHIDKNEFEPQQYADTLATALASPATCPDPTGADPRNCIIQPGFRRIRAYNYFDSSLRFAVTSVLKLTLTVTNLFNKKPPIVGQTVGTTTYNSGNTYPTTYDALGRRFAVGASVAF